MPCGLSLGATFSLPPAALAGLPVNPRCPSKWPEYRSHALTAGGTATANAHSPALNQFPTSGLREAATFDTSFLAARPGSGALARSQLADRTAPGDSDSDDHA